MTTTIVYGGGNLIATGSAARPTTTVAGDTVVGSGTLASPQGMGNLTIEARATLEVGDRISVDGGGTIDVAGGTVSSASIDLGMTAPARSTSTLEAMSASAVFSRWATRPERPVRPACFSAARSR